MSWGRGPTWMRLGAQWPSCGWFTYSILFKWWFSIAVLVYQMVNFLRMLKSVELVAMLSAGSKESTIPLGCPMSILFPIQNSHDDPPMKSPMKSPWNVPTHFSTPPLGIQAGPSPQHFPARESSGNSWRNVWLGDAIGWWSADESYSPVDGFVGGKIFTGNRQFSKIMGLSGVNFPHRPSHDIRWLIG